MGQTIQFHVDDTSPTVSYSPISDTLTTPNLTVGWNPYYSNSGFARSIGDTGQGESYHVTSLDGASLFISWKGTGVQVLGYSNGSNYDVLLDGAVQTVLGNSTGDNILITFQNLTNAPHNVTLRTKLPAGPGPALPSLFFNKALIITEADAASNTKMSRRHLTDSSIFYTGAWVVQNVTNRTVHVSTGMGDSLVTTFNGSSFMLTGQTSPKSGSYSVTLDNQTTTYSSQSSFVRRDTLLFFATGLNPNQTHELHVKNNGGELALNADGFTVFVAEPQPSPSSSAALRNSISKGTIAALVLGGILAFLALTSLLFFCFVVRPRRGRARQAAELRSRLEPKEHQPILDIAPAPIGRPSVYTYDTNGYVRDVESTIHHGEAPTNANNGNRSSVPSGFMRWKWDLEANLEGLGLSIKFRHSTSTGARTSRRSGSNSNDERSPRQGSWTRMSWKGKKKAKGSPNVSNGSWSPGVALELPVRPLSRTSSDEAKDKEGADSKPYSITSGLDSLSYISSPHAYAFTHANAKRSSNGNGGQPSRPQQPISRTFTTSQCNSHSASGRHGRQGSVGLLLTRGGEPNVVSEDEASQQTTNYEPVIGIIIPPTLHDQARDQRRYPVATSSGTRENRGSVNNTTEESASYLESSITRHAIRGLSPRTSRVEQAIPASSSRPGTGDRHPRPEAVAGSSRPKADTSSRPGTGSRSEQKRPGTGGSSSQGPDSSFLDVGSPDQPSIEMRLEEGLSVESSSSPQTRSSFLEFRPPSPLQVDLSGVAAEEPKQQDVPKAESKAPDEKRVTITTCDPRSVFRLTPDFRAPVHGWPSPQRNGSSSFLDFSSSSDTSYKTKSMSTSEFSQPYAGSISAQLHHQHAPSQSFSRVNQRTSMALSHSTEFTHLSNVSGLPGSPPSNRDSFFPYPVTFAPSSPFYNPSMQQMQMNPPLPSPSRQTELRPPQLPPIIIPPPDVGNVRASNGSEGWHPTSIVISPTDSVPVSVSELRFRHSDSTSGSLSARLPPHPPLPGSARSRAEFGPAPLSSPSYIVQQVLGRSPDRSGTQPTPGPLSTPRTNSRLERPS